MTIEDKGKDILYQVNTLSAPTLSWSDVKALAEYMLSGGKFPEGLSTLRLMCWEDEVSGSDPDCDDRHWE